MHLLMKLDSLVHQVRRVMQHFQLVYRSVDISQRGELTSGNRSQVNLCESSDITFLKGKNWS